MSKLLLGREVAPMWSLQWHMEQIRGERRRRSRKVRGRRLPWSRMSVLQRDAAVRAIREGR